jgi:acetylornithine deacetylase/succinyl-diaminopimelate desuccinylase-like protein
MRLAALCVTLAAALSLTFVAVRPPSPAPADAPAGTFSAQRALSDVVVMAKSPHPVGSPANAQVRDFLLARMTALGLAPEVQPAFALRKIARLQQPLFVGGQVENIVGVLPGRDRTAPALAIMAHYDSVPGSPGAGDDAAGVAAALELARILRLQGTPARDVIFLITDGEEAGLLGADAAFTQMPLARRVGFLINMEARGGGGLAQMFQTGARNAGTVEVLRHNASRPSASSLAVLLY